MTDEKISSAFIRFSTQVREAIPVEAFFDEFWVSQNVFKSEFTTLAKNKLNETTDAGKDEENFGKVG